MLELKYLTWIYLVIRSFCWLWHLTFFFKMTSVITSKWYYESFHIAYEHFLWQDLSTGFKIFVFWSWSSLKLAIIGGICVLQRHFVWTEQVRSSPVTGERGKPRVSGFLYFHIDDRSYQHYLTCRVWKCTD